jgi:hypothetical protein
MTESKAQVQTLRAVAALRIPEPLLLFTVVTLLNKNNGLIQFLELIFSKGHIYDAAALRYNSRKHPPLKHGRK